MPPLLRFIIRRFMVIPVSLLIITMVLYAGVMLTPPEARAQLYIPERLNPNLTEEQFEKIQEVIIKRYHLRDPYLVQYGYWIVSLFDGTWGYSPSMKEYVLPSLTKRTPITLELMLYSLILFIPFGLISGVLAGWRRSSGYDNLFRGTAFMSISTPMFILALYLLSIFYVKLNLFAPGRIGLEGSLELSKDTFNQCTGFLTLDLLLNKRPEMLVDAWKHLAVPVITISLPQWAILGRVTRLAMISEKDNGYIVSARARGLPESKLMWKHAFSNTLPPSLTSIALSAATIITGVFVSEIIFDFNGVSYVIVKAMSNIPDAPAALGFAVYSVIMVLVLMFFLDVLQAIFDPRGREGILKP